MNKSTLALISGLITLCLCLISFFVFRNVTFIDGLLAVCTVCSFCQYYYYRKKGE